ncbi:MAG: hypothetical protein LBM06_04575 [Prevotellaceae bacterium]|jgi:serine/threonine protein phosphatase PrpC|nr:hypothetical protein [Prevotellaceae bacterium]
MLQFSASNIGNILSQKIIQEIEEQYVKGEITLQEKDEKLQRVCDLGFQTEEESYQEAAEEASSKANKHRRTFIGSLIILIIIYISISPIEWVKESRRNTIIGSFVSALVGERTSANAGFIATNGVYLVQLGNDYYGFRINKGKTLINSTIDFILLFLFIYLILRCGYSFLGMIRQGIKKQAYEDVT